jgi:hypothetical protein
VQAASTRLADSPSAIGLNRFVRDTLLFSLSRPIDVAVVDGPQLACQGPAGTVL